MRCTLFTASYGLYYNYHRNYDPKIGGYTQSDPIGLAGGINAYTYVLNNPVKNTDPTGEFVPAMIFVGQMAWGAYQGYQAAMEFNQAQCNNPKPNSDMNDGLGPMPRDEAGHNANTASNALDSFSPGLTKAMAATAMSGVTGKFGAGAAGAFMGYAAGAYYGTQQACSCQQ
jgi:RHS repeat-associated protein